eukprot:scaffold50847_cov18-Tisochrysis_lutea.AAC.1
MAHRPCWCPARRSCCLGGLFAQMQPTTVQRATVQPKRPTSLHQARANKHTSQQVAHQINGTCVPAAAALQNWARLACPTSCRPQSTTAACDGPRWVP